MILSRRVQPVKARLPTVPLVALEKADFKLIFISYREHFIFAFVAGLPRVLIATRCQRFNFTERFSPITHFLVVGFAMTRVKAAGFVSNWIMSL